MNTSLDYFRSSQSSVVAFTVIKFTFFFRSYKTEIVYTPLNLSFVDVTDGYWF